jgi:hypothetical protein
MKMKKTLLPIAFAAVGVSVLALAGCSKKTPVARVEIEPRLVRLPYSQLSTVRLTWTPSAALGEEAPTVFVHLLDGKKKVARTFDHAFPQKWREGAPVSYDLKLYQSGIAPPLAPGHYQVTMGLYGKNGDRWPLDGLGEPVAKNEYNAFEVEVPAQQGKTRFAFSPAWMEPEPGGDRQVLARRWLVDRAAIRLVNQKAPGTVWMVVQIPPLNVPDYKLALSPGATTPSVKAVANCGGTETNLTGPGLHEVEMSLDAPPGDGFCRVILSANFMLEPTTATGKKRSVSLENIAWLPAGGGAAKRKPKEQSAQETSLPTAPQ